MLRTVLRISLIVALILYMAVALGFTSRLADMRQCRGLQLRLIDEKEIGFVKPDELIKDLAPFSSMAEGHPLNSFPLDSLERVLAASDKIESVEAVVLTNDSVCVTVRPLVPVARIFDEDVSYYINRDGKTISAEARYHMDVPVISGKFRSKSINPTDLLPLVDYISGHPEWRELISMIEVKDLDNIYLIPDIRGQVIKLGSVEALSDKFNRISRFYRRVLPYKGWNYYDTISVKWSGQVVASRCDKRRDNHSLPIDTLPQGAYDEAVPILTVGLERH